MGLLKVALVLLVCASSLTSATFFPEDEGTKKSNPVFLMLDIFEKGLMREIRNYNLYGQRSEIFDMYIEEVTMNPDMASENPDPSILTCAACRVYVASLLNDRRNGAPAEDLAESAFGMCRIVTDYSEEMCRGLINLNVEPMIYIVDSRPSLTANQICGLVLQGQCGALDQMFSFSLSISPGQPINAPKTVASPWSPNDMKIVHISDVHFDENYVEGNNAVCSNSVCCRRNDGLPTNPANGGGFWGDYRDCGTPWRSIENTLRRIRSAHPDAELIYHTGDMRDHGIWETTVDGNRRIMDRLFNLFREVFGTTPVFHVLGNHEAQPVNLFAPSIVTRPTISASWLYSYSADAWLRHGWITPAAANTVRQGGYYTISVRPGFRVIVLNNNDCYTYNYWILYSVNEVRAQLQWLHDTLLAAEQNHERVHILKHIRNGGGSCTQFWQREYRRVIDRFHNIIGAQFNGHSHRVEQEVFYDSPTSQHAINVAWNGGSATAFVGVNPNYLVYSVDRMHYQVTDFDSYIFSISEANRTPAQSPRWFRNFQFRSTFGLNLLSPAALDVLAFDMSRNRNLLRRYWEMKVKSADPHMERGCDDNCLRGHVCAMVTNQREESRRCDQVLAVFGTVA